jgi:hypothetical protein
MALAAGQPTLEGAVMTALIPAWILGAPLVLAIIDLLRTPRPR